MHTYIGTHKHARVHTHTHKPICPISSPSGLERGDKYPGLMWWQSGVWTRPKGWCLSVQSFAAKFVFAYDWMKAGASSVTCEHAFLSCTVCLCALIPWKLQPEEPYSFPICSKTWSTHPMSHANHIAGSWHSDNQDTQKTVTQTCTWQIHRQPDNTPRVTPFVSFFATFSSSADRYCPSVSLLLTQRVTCPPPSESSPHQTHTPWLLVRQDKRCGHLTQKLHLNCWGQFSKKHTIPCNFHAPFCVETAPHRLVQLYVK